MLAAWTLSANEHLCIRMSITSSELLFFIWSSCVFPVLITVIPNFHHSLKLLNLFDSPYSQCYSFLYNLESKQKPICFLCYPLSPPCFCHKWWNGLFNLWSWSHSSLLLWAPCSIYPALPTNLSHLLKISLTFFLQSLFNLLFLLERKKTHMSDILMGSLIHNYLKYSLLFLNPLNKEFLKIEV